MKREDACRTRGAVRALELERTGARAHAVLRAPKVCMLPIILHM